LKAVRGTACWSCDLGLHADIFSQQVSRSRAVAGQLSSLDLWRRADDVLPSMMVTLAPGYAFLFLCGMIVGHLIGVRLMISETKGVPLEAIERRLEISP
jgi:hypothetical protein